MSNKEERARQRDFVETFTSVAGERVVRALHASYGGPVFHENALEMARREGRREVLLAILRVIGQADRVFEIEALEEDE